jgi:hypothetical protein
VSAQDVSAATKEPWDAGEVRLVLGAGVLIIIWLLSLVLLRRWRRH